MGNLITNLKVRFGVDTSDFKKGLKDGEKATEDFKGAAGGAIDEFASMFGVNMNGITESLSTANKSLNFLSQSFTAAKKGGDTFAIGMKVVKSALISTGIGALVVLLGSLMTYFTQSGSGAERFGKILTQLKSVFNNVIERIMKLGEGLADIFSGKFQQGWEKMSTAFKGMGEEIKNDWKASGELAKAWEDLEDKEMALITASEERKQKIAELRQQAKEETNDQKRKLDLLAQAEKLIKQETSAQVDASKTRLELMAKELSLKAVDQSPDVLAAEEKSISLLKEKLGLQGKDITDEQLTSVLEQQAKLNQLYRDQAVELKGLQREKGSTLKIVEQEIEAEKQLLALKNTKTSQASIILPDISNIKLPDFGQTFTTALAPLSTFQQKVKEVSFDINDSLKSAFTGVATGMGEFLGALASGTNKSGDLAKALLLPIASTMNQLGQLAIASGIAVEGIKAAFKMHPVAAVIGGIALIALASAITGSVGKLATGGSSSGSSVGSSDSLTYDSRSAAVASNSNFAGANEIIERPVFNVEAIKLLGTTIKESLVPLVTEFQAVATSISQFFSVLSNTPSRATTTEKTNTEQITEKTESQLVIEKQSQITEIPAPVLNFDPLLAVGNSIRDTISALAIALTGKTPAAAVNEKLTEKTNTEQITEKTESQLVIEKQSQITEIPAPVLNFDPLLAVGNSIRDTISALAIALTGKTPAAAVNEKLTEKTNTEQITEKTESQLVIEKQSQITEIPAPVLNFDPLLAVGNSIRDTISALAIALTGKTPAAAVNEKLTEKINSEQITEKTESQLVIEKQSLIPGIPVPAFNFDPLVTIGNAIKDTLSGLAASLAIKTPGTTSTNQTLIPAIPSLNFDFKSLKSLESIGFDLRDRLASVPQMNPAMYSFAGGPASVSGSSGIKTVHLKLSGELIGTGKTLRAVINEEDARINIAT